MVLDGAEKRTPEEFVAHYFENLEFNVMHLESSPFHALFGCLMFQLIQDPLDPRLKTIGFGDRDEFDFGVNGKCIWTSLPEDFGSSGYALRREKEIGEYFDALPKCNEDLIWLFDLGVEYSSDLRQYLWAHRAGHVNKGRALINILPVAKIVDILKYLIRDYWRNYLGWPDLLVFSGDEFFFAEVKSSSDKLSEDQKRWIKDNYSELHLPFKLVKIHKEKSK